MPTSKKHRGLVAVAVILIVVFLAVSQVQSTIAGRGQFSGSTDTFRYSGQDDNGGIYMVVSVDTSDPTALKKYVEANRQRGQALVSQNKGEVVPVQITFARPMLVSDVKTLVERTGFQVTSFSLVGYSTLSRKRGTHVQFDSLQSDIPEREIVDPKTGDELVFTGIMVLQGEVKANADGLGQWLANDEVYLVDTSKLEALSIAASRHATETANKPIDISLPTPFWNLDW